MQLTRSASECAVLDLDSLNGTFVNGLPVKERELRAGDLITIGDSLFLFAQRGVESTKGLRRVDTTDGAKSGFAGAVSSAVEFDRPGESRGRATTRTRTEDLLYLRPEKLVEALPSAGRLEQDLQALLKVAATIGSENGLEALEQQLLDSMLEVVSAERAAIFLVEDDPNQDFHFGPGTATVYTRVAPNTTSFRAEPCTSPPPIGARARPSAHRRWLSGLNGAPADTAPAKPFWSQKLLILARATLPTGHRQRPDPPQHVAKQPPVQMSLRQ